VRYEGRGVYANWSTNLPLVERDEGGWKSLFVGRMRRVMRDMLTNVDQIKEMISSPSKDRILIGNVSSLLIYHYLPLIQTKRHPRAL
jgi:hypothetical protein